MAKSKPHILLIDDSMVDQRLLIGLLTAHQYRVSVAFNGREGVQKSELLKPDLILLDINMPDMNGFAACRLIKQAPLTRHIPVIFLSAANDPDQRLQGLKLGAVDFIAKPFNEEEVLARVGIHLELSRANRAWAQQHPARPTRPPAGDASAPSGSKDAALVNAAVDYLREQISAPPSPEALAELLACNEKRLNQAFNTHFGMPVFAWLRQERLQQACHLLSSTDTPVAVISEYLGFSTASNFAKAFKEGMGCSPREFRLRKCPDSQADHHA